MSSCEPSLYLPNWEIHRYNIVSNNLLPSWQSYYHIFYFRGIKEHRVLVVKCNGIISSICVAQFINKNHFKEILMFTMKSWLAHGFVIYEAGDDV